MAALCKYQKLETERLSNAPKFTGNLRKRRWCDSAYAQNDKVGKVDHHHVEASAKEPLLNVRPSSAYNPSSDAQALGPKIHLGDGVRAIAPSPAAACDLGSLGNG